MVKKLILIYSIVFLLAGLLLVNSIRILGTILLILLLFSLCIVVWAGIKKIVQNRIKNKKAGVIICSVSFALIFLMFGFFLFPTDWRYPDILIRNMPVYKISKWWGEYDYVKNTATGDMDNVYEVAGYYLYTDEKGVKQYYFIYSHTDCTDLSYETYVSKGDRYISNWVDYFGKNDTAAVYDTGIDRYLREFKQNQGLLIWNADIGGSEEKELEYLGITKEQFMKYINEKDYFES